MQRSSLPVAVISIVLVLTSMFSTDRAAQSQAGPATLTLKLVNIIPFYPGLDCPPAPPGTFLIFWEVAEVQAPDGNIMGTEEACHYVIPESLTSEPYPQRGQIALGTFDLAGGTIEFTLFLTVSTLPGGFSKFKITGEVTGGSGEYEDASGTINGSGPLRFSEALGLHVPSPLILHVWS